MSAHQEQLAPVEIPYLAICGWDIERWQSSRAYRLMDLAAQGAYLNLCFSAWKHQPSCELPGDDRELWRLANARTQAGWQAVKSEVFNSDAWTWTGRGWLNEVVHETYVASVERHRVAVRAGRIAGKASARARRALAQATHIKEDRTTVERSLTQGRSTIVNPSSSSPSSSPTTATTTPPPPPPAAVGPAPGGDWDLPPGIADDHPPAQPTEIVTSPQSRARALERLVAGAGEEIGTKKRNELRQRLKAGAREEDLADEIRQAAEKRRMADTEARQWDAALDWIDAHGGVAMVLKEALSWLSTHHGEGDDLQISLRRWEQQVHAPPKVASRILPDVAMAYQRAPRVARGG